MKQFATLVVGLALGVAVAQGQNMRMVQEVVASGATDATNATMRMMGTIGQGVIGTVAGNANVDYQGFWHIPALASGVEIGVTGPPADFQLFQNYPNPFNPATTIKFSVPKSTHIALRVISMTGALVKTLVNENYAAGSYSVVFTANEIPTGTYLYQLEAGGQVMTKRMILIK